MYHMYLYLFITTVETTTHLLTLTLMIFILPVIDTSMQYNLNDNEKRQGLKELVSYFCFFILLIRGAILYIIKHTYL